MNDKQSPEFLGTGVSERIARLSPDKRALLLERLSKAPKRPGAGERGETVALEPVPRGGDLPLSFAQQRLWFLDRLLPGGSTYNVPAAWRLEGPLDVAALARSAAAVVARHESLRTRVVLRAGTPVQTIDPASSDVLRVTDLSALAPAAREARARMLTDAHARQPFDLAVGPLLRAEVLRLATEEHVLLVNMHHIVSDGWSVGVFHRELAAAYDAFVQGHEPVFPGLPIQYADYAVWQRAWLQGSVLAAQAAYWRRQLDGVTTLELPTDRAHPPVPSHRGGYVNFELPGQLVRAIRELGRAEGATLFMTLLAGFQVVLHRYSGQEDIAVGTPIAGRGRPELEGLVGCFINTLVMRSDLSGNPSFRALLARVRDTALEAYTHQDLPFEKLVEELAPARDLSRHPLFQVLFVLQNVPGAPLSLDGVSVSRLSRDNQTAKFDLALSVRESGVGLHLRWEYASDLFEAATIERMAGHFQVLLEAIVTDPDQAIGALPLLTEAERHQVLVAWNDTAIAFPREGCIHQLVEAQAARTPDAVAVVDDDSELTYAELNARANQLAHRLVALGVGPDVLVGICLERSADLVVGVMGILKAGGAYVPLDPSYPAARLAFVLADTHAPVLVTQEALLAQLPLFGGHVLCLDRDAPAISVQPDTDVPCAATAESLAYVIYTSGSTGTPKGVAIEHRSSWTFLHWAAQVFSRDELAGTLFATSICFDLSVFEIFAPLSRGGAVIVADNALQLPHLSHAGRVTLINTVPSAMTELLRIGGVPGSVRTVNLAGERMPGSLVHGVYEATRVEKLYNLYGPTEDTTYSTFALIDRGTEAPTIGRPIANTRVYVLDPSLRPVPVGVTGELYIGGDGLARGYWQRPELTSERFVRDPFGVPGARMYRTGDRVRYLANGDLEFLGRFDDQVKIRGFRIELGEIEAVLGEHPAVRQAVVLAREDTPGDKRLVAYVVPRDAALVDVELLRTFVRTRLPDYMQPGAFVVLEQLPLTPAGKLDRRALPAPQYGRSATADPMVAPRDALEAVIAEVWCEVLRVEQMGVHDNFFEMGGHSLLATQVIARLSLLLQLDIPLYAFFEFPTVSGLAAAAQQRLGAETGREAVVAAAGAVREDATLGPVARVADLPLSFAQQRLWFLDRLAPGTSTYNMPAAWQLEGPLEVAALARSVTAVVARHESLRTRVVLRAGAPVQVIDPAPSEVLVLTDLSALTSPARETRAQALIEAHANEPFDLAAGPLFRAEVLRLSAEEHVLLANVHHIASDGWSLGVFHRDLATAYGACVRGIEPVFPALPIQYADYAVWQRAWLQGAVLVAQRAYWQRQLADIHPLELPTDRPRPSIARNQGGELTVKMPAPLTAAIKELGRREGTTLFMTLLAGFQVLLFRHSGQTDIAVGSPIAGRGHPDLENLIGFFVNTLVMRSDLSGDPSFRALLARVRDMALGAYTHQDLPFEKLVEELAPTRDMSRHPLFQVMFVLQNAPGAPLALDGVTVNRLPRATENAKFDLLLTVRESAAGLYLRWEYASDLFEAATILRLAGHFQVLLEAIVADPARRIEELPLLTEAERQQLLVAWNNTAADYPDSCVHQLFEAQAARIPDAVAVVDADRQLTYAELNARANQLAHRLIALGVSPGVLVGICLERSADVVVGLLGILKAGGVYVPLDPSYPAARLAFMLTDTQAPLLVTHQRLLAQLPPFAGQVLCLDRDAPEIAAHPDTDLPCAATVESLAYVIYTSGSTGTPKGILLPHATLVNLMAWHGPGASGGRVAQFTSISFDVSLQEILSALLFGKTLVVVDDDTRMQPDRFAAFLQDRGITDLFVPNVVLQYVAQAVVQDQRSLPALANVYQAGEALTVTPVVQAFFESHPACRLHNHYGPAETHVVTAETSSADPGSWPSRPAIGSAISNTRLYVLDRHRHPVPVGVTGELYIDGDGLARGYLNRPELTTEKFLPNPFSNVREARMYRTGDRVRYLANGSLEFLGRLDDQVKIRGFRIELGEIEAVLGEHPKVRQAVVVALEDTPGDTRLVAYVVPADAAKDDTEQLRTFLRTRLPDYMRPAAYVVLAQLPLTPTGKLDRRALPAPLYGRDSAADSFVAPRDAVEEVIAEVWREVLRVEQVGVHDNFFELGGHSLLATQVVARLSRLLPVELSLHGFFEFPTVSALAAAAQQQLGVQSGGEAVGLAPVARTGDLPLSFAQQRLWFLDRLLPGASTYNMPTAWRLQGPLEVPALARSVAVVVARHESLRTRVVPRDGAPVQVIDAAPPESLLLTDLSGLAPAEREARARALAETHAHVPFDLAVGPLFRAHVLRLAADEHVLLVNVHHIASDGWSTGVFNRELSEAYGAVLEGREPKLPPLPIQYADYAVWQRAWLQGSVLAAQRAYWQRQLADLRPLELPTDWPRPPVARHQGGHLIVDVPVPVTVALKDLGRREGATLFMTLLAAFQVLLSRYSGQTDIAVGSPIAGRGRPELEGLIGFFINTLVLRSDLSGDPSFRDLLARVRDTALGAYTHQDLPFEKLVEELAPARDQSRHPLFQVLFVLQNAPSAPLVLDRVVVDRLPLGGQTAKFDLTLSVRESAGGLQMRWEYSSDLFGAATIGRLAGHFQVLLEAIVADPARRIGELPLLTEAERHQLLVAWNATSTDYPIDLCVHQLVETQALRTPDAMAVVCDDRHLTYVALNARANQVAHQLRTLGVGPEVLVGVCLERSLDLVVGLLGILKAGGAYVPLDPSYPQSRIAFMLDDTHAPVLVTQQALVAQLPPFAGHLLCLDRDAATIAAQPDTNLLCAATADTLAYVMYTSGSTGTPKGVAVRHRGITRLVCNTNYVEIDSTDCVAQISNPAFDAATFEVWGALANGASLVIIPRDVTLDLSRLPDELRRRRVSTMFLTTALFNEVVRARADAFVDLKQLLVGGEALDPHWVRECLRAGGPKRLLNGYGPTECTTFATSHLVEAVEPGARSIPIGRPIANTVTYVLDRHRQAVPIGVAGELHIGGAGLARGYWNRPELTTEKFVPDPFSEAPGARMYRTGDRVRCLASGDLEFLGRFDDQVKIRGFRIELGEIEAVLGEHPAVRQNVVLAREDTPGDKRLVGYVVPADAAGADIESLRAFLRTRLPDYMRPAAYVVLEQLPLTATGKLDRRALPAPSRGLEDSAGRHELPRDEVERTLCRLWAKVLKTTQVGIDDDFFELGGHSLLAAQLFARMDQAFGRSLPLATLFDAPTVRGLARFYRDGFEPAVGVAVVPITSSGSLPRVFAVPGVGGNVLGFTTLARDLGSEQPFFGLQSVGLDGAREPLESIEQMATHYLSEVRQIQPGGPYHLLGACFGATVAFEMTRQLLDAGEEVAFLGLFDPSSLGGDLAGQPTLPLPAWLKRGTALTSFVASRVALYLKQMRSLGYRQRVQLVGSKLKLVGEIIDKRDLLRGDHRTFHQRRVSAVNLRALRRYRHEPLHGGPGAIEIFRTDRFARAGVDLGVDWASLVGKSITYHSMPGKNSGDMLQGEHAKTLATLLSTRLGQARRS